MYEKALIPVVDQPSFVEVHAAIARSFTPGNVQDFLRSLQRAGIRIRDFEGVITHNLLGPAATAAAAKLDNADLGQIREFYLASVERVAPEMRAKFLKLYAYY